MNKVQLRVTPVMLELGGRARELRFNLNAALLLREAGKDGANVWEQVGERSVEGGEPEKIYRVDLGNLRLYLWAMLQADARKRGEALTADDVGELLADHSIMQEATRAVGQEIARWYGLPLGGV